jgi:hypothetical protein
MTIWATLDPARFVDTYDPVGRGRPIFVLTPGEELVIGADGSVR